MSSRNDALEYADRVKRLEEELYWWASKGEARVIAECLMTVLISDDLLSIRHHLWPTKGQAVSNPGVPGGGIANAAAEEPIHPGLRDLGQYLSGPDPNPAASPGRRVLQVSIGIGL